MYKTLRYIALILSVVLMTLALSNKAGAVPAVDTTPYSLPCNFTTNFATYQVNWLHRFLNETGAGNPAQHSAHGGFKSPNYQAVLVRHGSNTYYTFYLGYSGQANLKMQLQSSGVLRLVNQSEPSTGNFPSGSYKWFSLAYAGSVASGWQQHPGAIHNTDPVSEVCGYTDNVAIERLDGSTLTSTYRKYFPFSDQNIRMVGGQWHFMDTKTAEPTATTTTTTTSGITKTELEEVLVKITALSTALVLGGALAYQFRFRG